MPDRKGDKLISREVLRERALVLHPSVKSLKPKVQLEEAVGLALAIGLEVVLAEVVEMGRLNPATLIGSGRIEDYAEFIENENIAIAIIDASLSPTQQRNLERALGTKVIDRTGLILEIFGERARTSEGVLQVELAQLNYLKSRLVRTWTHLERQRGGAGFMGGPGERQIESDRRQIQEKITRIKKDLVTVAKRRALHRKARKEVPYPIIALAGYTNAGKSTLFNRLTGAEVEADSRLFETLDPTLRSIKLPGGRKVILSDTVGFISDLPTELVAAFKATLEEVLEADLILHVRDASNPEMEGQKKDVEAILASLGVDEDTPVVEIFNKIDLITPELAQTFEGGNSLVALSALSGKGTQDLLELMAGAFDALEPDVVVKLDEQDGKARAWLYQHGSAPRQTKSGLRLKLAPKAIGQFKKEFPEVKIKKKS